LTTGVLSKDSYSNNVSLQNPINIDNHHSFLVQLRTTRIPVWLHDEGTLDILKKMVGGCYDRKVVSSSQVRAWLIIVAFDCISS
jgi:hypothetical protein